MDYEATKKELASIYNKFASLHDEERKNFNNNDQLYMLSQLLPKNSKVLDAGCGTGMPVIKYFHDLGHEVYGSDIAVSALSYVKVHSPNAHTLLCDTADLSFPDNTFDLITSFYSMMHLPMDKQIIAFKKFYKMIKPNGSIYITLSCQEYTGETEFAGLHEFENWPLPIYHVSTEKYLQIFQEINFKNISLEKLNTGKDITLLWLYGTK